MSHFTVLVMGPDLDDEDELSRALLPYHEYECTGLVNEYVQHHDITAQVLEEYQNKTTPRYRLPDGRLLDPYDPSELKLYCAQATPEQKERIYDQKFEGEYRDFNGTLYVLNLPEGTEKVELPNSAVMPIADWLDDYYGFKELNEEELAAYERDGVEPDRSYCIIKDGELVKATRFTNKNAKWDWWVLGGRWNGAFKVKPGMEQYAQRGETGPFGEENPNYDLVRKDALDFETMKKEAVRTRRICWKQAYKKMLAVDPGLSEKEADRIRYEIFQIKQSLLEQWQKIEGENKPHFFTWAKDKMPAKLAPHFDGICDYFSSTVRDTADYENIKDWIESAPAISSYAMLVNGEWMARGEMGFFGISYDDKKLTDWDKQIEEQIQALPDDHWLALVDCHI